MADDNEQYRDVYRSARGALSLLEDRLTEPQRDAILREARRTAERKEQFWVAVSIIGGPLAYVIADSVAGLGWIQKIGVSVGVFVSFLLPALLAHKSRVRLLSREVMRILARKRIRPPICACCESEIDGDASDRCPGCGCVLAIDARPAGP